MSNRISGLILLILLLAVAACETRPLTPQEAADQHRFETGCRFVDAQGYEGNTPYCGHNGGNSGGTNGGGSRSR